MDPISLAGVWLFSLGSPAVGISPQAALPVITYTDEIELPGTTETRGKGPENTARETHHLTRIHKFDGPAWYARDIEIPAAWAGQRIELSLERTRYTQVWLDDRLCGDNPLVGSPQVYDLTSHATPGRHRLTILVDNRPERRPVQSEAHQWSDNTQTNWNGIIGKLELRAVPSLAVSAVEVVPDVSRHTLGISFQVGPPAQAGRARVVLAAESWNHAGPTHRPPPVRQEFEFQANEFLPLRLEFPLGADAHRWDEFSPALYRLTISVESGDTRTEHSLDVGLREFKTNGTQFTINGRPTFLRGKQEACVFPLTGHPPMEVEGWLQYLDTLRDYGINHLRCHTWIPPEAAFAAADRLGMYLQPELPYWGAWNDGIATALEGEMNGLFRAYGHHASFVMFTLGNELSGERDAIGRTLARLRARHVNQLHAGGSNNFLWDPRLQPEDQFWSTAKTRTPAGGETIHVARGSFFNGDGYAGHVQWGAPETRTDLRAATAGLPVPVVGHEIAQYTFYPDFRELPRYTGVTRPRNLEIFRAALERSGQLAQAHDFFRAAGALATELYREEIELATRTSGFGGYQLLDLQDFPGQGTALVGVLNALMESKGLVTPERWREFCAPVVALARFDRYTWTTAETFAADLELAHYGAEDWPDARITWRIIDVDEAPIASGALPRQDIARGNVRALGGITASLAEVTAPMRCDLEVSVVSGENRAHNRWPLWVYPAAAAHEESSTNFVVLRAFDADAKELLAAGERVVVMPDRGDWARTLRGAYATDFWCWPMFGSNPGTMGLLCDPAHPAFGRFPTAAHSERQWTRIADTSTPVILDGAPAALRPIVQVIDNLARNERLGLVFEAKVGRGSLLVIACDLLALDSYPEARQLYASLKHYAASSAFAPEVELTPEFLDTILRPSQTAGATITASSHFQPPWGRVPDPKLALDGDINSAWRAGENDATPVLTLDLGARRTIDTIELVWASDEAGYQYLLESSTDGGATWTTLSDQHTNTFARGRHVLAAAAATQHLRLTITGHPANVPASLREIRLLGAQSGKEVGSSEE